MRNSKVIAVRPSTVKEFQEMNNAIYSEANKHYFYDHLFRKFFEEVERTSRRSHLGGRGNDSLTKSIKSKMMQGFKDIFMNTPKVFD